jgi:hypothetical protein
VNYQFTALTYSFGYEYIDPVSRVSDAGLGVSGENRLSAGRGVSDIRFKPDSDAWLAQKISNHLF